MTLLSGLYYKVKLKDKQMKKYYGAKEGERMEGLFIPKRDRAFSEQILIRVEGQTKEKYKQIPDRSDWIRGVVEKAIEEKIKELEI